VGLISHAPASNADMRRTIAELLHLDLASSDHPNARVLREALPGARNKTAPQAMSQTLTSTPSVAGMIARYDPAAPPAFRGEHHDGKRAVLHPPVPDDFQARSQGKSDVHDGGVERIVEPGEEPFLAIARHIDTETGVDELRLQFFSHRGFVFDHQNAHY
jgi:hypothetical protein